uniref:Uncharacterized protein n=1 Tax=Cajanus cajan TaxID=3821 RepID=A0A151RKP1_CAJCA|nr:hypothetical protein KK1_035443 [Cajanus cajan]
MVKQMAELNLQYQQKNDASIQNLTNQIGQLATTVNQLQAPNSNKLPAQNVINPKNVNAITLRLGKKTIDEVPVPPTTQLPYIQQQDPPTLAVDQLEEELVHSNNLSPSTCQHQLVSIPFSFPLRAVQCKKTKEIDKEILDIFRKV